MRRESIMKKIMAALQIYQGTGIFKARYLPILLAEQSAKLVKTALMMLVLNGLCAGCALIKSTFELPDKTIQSISSYVGEGEKTDPVELQSQLIRFSDHYLEAMTSASNRLRQDDDQRPERRTLLRRRIVIINDVLAIATGSNAYANLLDMIVLVTLNRINTESWLPERYGESTKPLQTAAQESEKEIWRIAEATLKQEQITELRTNIDAWLSQHNGGRARRDVGTLGLASEIAKMYKTNQANKSSVFNLSMIDPFAGLDPATSELASTRLFAERGLFLTRHMPTLLRLETELLAIQSLEIPKLENLLASINQLATAAERFSQVSEQLPAVIGSEREHIVQALDLQRPGLISLAAQTEKALSAGKFMSEATNTTLKTFQDVVKHLEGSSSDPKSEPFEIGDYAAAAAQISATAKSLTEFLDVFGKTISQERLDALSERMDLLDKKAQTSGKELVDYAFKKLLLLGGLLIMLSAVMVLVTCFAYWALKKRFAKP